MSETLRLIRLHREGPEGQGMVPMDLDPADFQSPLPKQNIGIFYENAARGITVGVWDTTSMQEALGPYPGDEVVWILEGDFSMVTEDGRAAPAGEGDFVALRNGAPMSWKQDGYLRKFFLIYLKPGTPQPKLEHMGDMVVVADQSAQMVSRSDVPVDAAECHEDFRNDTGDLTVGTWKSGPASGKMEPYPADEFAVVLEGAATVTEQAGEVHILKAGDCFFLPKGTICQTEVPDHIKAHYARIETG